MDSRVALDWGTFPPYDPRTMATFRILLTPGDGIGPDVMGPPKTVIAWFHAPGAGPTFDEDLAGRCAHYDHRTTTPAATIT